MVNNPDYSLKPKENKNQKSDWQFSENFLANLIRFPRKVPVNPCKHLQCILSKAESVHTCTYCPTERLCQFSCRKKKMTPLNAHFFFHTLPTSDHYSFLKTIDATYTCTIIYI